MMSLVLTLLLAAAEAPTEAPRAITGALGVRIGEIVSDAELRELGFARDGDSQLWRRADPGYFPEARLGRSLSGRVLNVIFERRWTDEDGLSDCQEAQRAFADVIRGARPELVREEIGPKDILFVKLREAGWVNNARSIDIVCSFIPTRVPPTLRIIWDVSPIERAAAYAEPVPAGSGTSSE